MTAASGSDRREDPFADLRELAESELQSITTWCSERARARVDAKEAKAVVADRTDAERCGMVLALLQLYADLAQQRVQDPVAGSQAGFFGYYGPAARLMRDLAGRRLRWSGDQARSLAYYAYQQDVTTGTPASTLCAIAARGLEQLDDEDLKASARELASLRVAADSVWGTDGETERIATVQRLKRLVWRVGAGSRDKIGRAAFDWRDDFGQAARVAVLRVVPENEAAVALEVLGLYGTGSQPLRSWWTWVDEVGATQVAKVARALLETVLILEDNPDVYNPEQYPILLGPESMITTRGAAWALTLAQVPDDVRLLHDVALACARKPTAPRDTRPMRAAGLASSSVAALGRFTPHRDAAADALQDIHDCVLNASVKKQAGDAKAELLR